MSYPIEGRVLLALASVFYAGIHGNALKQQAPAGSTGTTSQMKPLAINQLCVTEGRIEATAMGPFRINESKVRAVAMNMTEQEVSLRFRYRGLTADRVPLASGEMRSQFGLKLRAANGCNVLYAMWRIEPESKLVVQLKHNPGMTTSSQCGNSGYDTLKPQTSAPVPVLKPGSQHTLTAKLSGSQLTVTADGASVWQGQVDPTALSFSGPVGVRTDNVMLDFQLLTPPAGEAVACKPTTE